MKKDKLLVSSNAAERLTKLANALLEEINSRKDNGGVIGDLENLRIELTIFVQAMMENQNYKHYGIQST